MIRIINVMFCLIIQLVNDAPEPIIRNITTYLNEIFGPLMRRLSSDENVCVYKHVGMIIDSILR